MHDRRCGGHCCLEGHAKGLARGREVDSVAPAEFEIRRSGKVFGFRQPPGRVEGGAGDDDRCVPAIAHDHHRMAARSVLGQWQRCHAGAGGEPSGAQQGGPDCERVSHGCLYGLRAVMGQCIPNSRGLDGIRSAGAVGRRRFRARVRQGLGLESRGFCKGGIPFARPVEMPGRQFQVSKHVEGAFGGFG